MRKRKKNTVHSNIPPSKPVTRKMTLEEIREMDKRALHNLKGIYGKYMLNDWYGHEHMEGLKSRIDELEQKILN